MFKKVLILMAVVLVFSFCEVQAEVIHSTWVGGEYGEWGNPENWNPAIVPDNNESYSFFVTIDSNTLGIDRIEVQLLQNYTINQLDTYGDVQLDVPDWEDAPSCSTIMFTVLEPNNGLTNYGMFEVDQEKHREIEINGNVTNTAGAEIGLSETNINGNFYNESGGIVDIGYKCEINRNFENAGTMNLWGPDVILWIEDTLHNVNQINLISADCGANRIVNDSNGVIQGSGYLDTEHEDELLQNKGEIYACDGSLVIWTEEQPLLNTGVLGNKPASFLHVRVHLGTAKDVNNHGTIEVHAGGATAFDRNLVNEPNATIELLGGTLAAETIVQKADANFQGQGNIATANLIIETDGLIRLTGPTNIFGNVQINPNATLEISDGQTLIKGETICNNGTIHMIGGRVICQGGLTNNNCNIIWEPGIYTNLADFNLDGTVNFKDFADFADTWLWQANWYAP